MNKEESPMGEASQQPRERLQPLIEQGHSTNALYSNLKDTDEIRLLYLEPKTSGEIINCALKNARLSNLPKCEALSYMWGPKDVRTEQSISIDNSNFYVRENLWLALQHLRLETEIRVLWIDAICINQHETQERNHQVSQMGIIFKEAAMVIIWLGDADDASTLAFRFISPSEGHAYIIRTDDPATSLEGNHKLKVIETIFLKDYWRRLWIIQEFLMARDYMLQCGNNTCTRFRLCYFLDAIGHILTHPPNKSVLSKERAEIARRISQTIPARLVQQRAKEQAMMQGGCGSTFGKDHTSEPVPQPLLKLFVENKAAECHDPRDRIFGLHSLASICCKREIPVNYSLSWREVLRTLVRHQASHPSITPKILKFPKYSWQLPQSTVKEFQEVYRTMANLSRDCDQERSSAKFTFAFNNFVERIGAVNSNTPIRVPGYIRGRIYYSSPLFSSKSVTTMTVPVPNITSGTEIQLRHICSQFEKRDSAFATWLGKKLTLSLRLPRLNTRAARRHPHMSSELDLVDSFSPQDVALNLDDPRFTTFEEKLMHCLGVKMPRTAPGSAARRNFLNLLYSAHRAVSREDVVLALEETGLIIFAPPSTQVGHLVCQFPESDILALIPPTGVENGFWSVKRAVNFLAAPPTTTAALCGKTESFCDRDEEPRILLTLEAPEIMKLCKSSETPNGKHNIPTEGVGDRMSGGQKILSKVLLKGLRV
jgi:hypothetical protein